MFDNKKICQIKTFFFKQRKKLFLMIFVLNVVKIAKNIVLSFTCHVTTSRALLDANILTIVYKLYLSYIVKIQCVYHLFLTDYELEKQVIYLYSIYIFH